MAGSSANYGIARQAWYTELMRGSDARWETPNVAVLNPTENVVQMIVWMQLLVLRSRLFGIWGDPSTTLVVSVFRKLPSDAQCIAVREFELPTWAPEPRHMHVRMVNRLLQMNLSATEDRTDRTLRGVEFELDVDQAPSTLMEWGAFQAARWAQSLLPVSMRTGVCRYPKWALTLYEPKK